MSDDNNTVESLAEDTEETLAVTDSGDTENNATHGATQGGSAEEEANDEETADTNDSTDDETTQEVESDDDESNGDNDADEYDELLRPLKKLRNENRSLRERLRTAEARIADLEAVSPDAAVVAERDEMKAQVAAITEKYHASTLSRLVQEASTEAGAIDPEVIAALVKRDAVTWEDDNPTNVKQIVADLKKKHPKLFGTVLANGNGGNRNERGGELEGLSSTQLLAEAYRD